MHVALLAGGANVNATDSNGNAALHKMAENGNEGACKLLMLIETGEDIARNAHVVAALHNTASHGTLATCQLLIGSVPTSTRATMRSGSPFLCGGDRQLHGVRRILDASGDIRTMKANGMPTIHGAVMIDHMAMYQMLIAGGH